MIDPLMIPMMLTICISGLVSVISQIQHSRCVSITSPCCSCIRKINDEQEPLIPFKNNMEEAQE
tara:strand:- start:720 stop:911 length:192 start_codon:yes stop_codon:yes gene_type:complete